MPWWCITENRFSVVLVFSNGLYFSSCRKFVKEQKQVQEDISRMSSKGISKVQDDIKSLKQLLSVNASGLQRQALAIDKLKLETAQVQTVHVTLKSKWEMSVFPTELNSMWGVGAGGRASGLL